MGEPSKKVEPAGWNDPPMLNYSASNPPPKSRIQNKRIGFSFNSSSLVNGSTSSSLPFNESPPNIPPSNVLTLYETGKENFNKVLSRIEDDQVQESIKKLLEMWEAGFLATDVQQYLYELATSLDNNDFGKSNQLHFKLCMNSSPQMTTYWQAIKMLITEVENKLNVN